MRIVFLLVVPLLFVGKFAVDPFGLSSVTLGHSASITLSLAAPWYRNKPGAETAGDLITTLLIDEKYVKAIRSIYPLPYDRQLDLLSSTILRSPLEGEGDVQVRAILIDLIYADKRDGAAGFLDELGAIAELDTLVGNADEDGLLAAANAWPELPRPAAGLLLMDETTDPVISTAAAGQSVRYRTQRASQIDFPSTVSRFEPGVLRYAIAPDGMLSPAFVLMLWTCATLEEENVAEAALKGCRDANDGRMPEGPVSFEAVRRAAHAASLARVARHCARRTAQLAEDPDETGIRARSLETCRHAARRYASNIRPAPPEPEGGAEKPGRVARYAALMRAYSRAARDGAFDGTFAGMTCSEGSLVDGILHPLDLVRTEAERIVRRCENIARDADEARIGPAMTVFWGASPRDGGPARTADTAGFYPTPSAPAAPYTWSMDGDGNRIVDRCLSYRFEQTTAARWRESFMRGIAYLNLHDNPYPDVCPYHTQINPQLVGYDIRNEHTRRYVNDAVDGRVLIVSASVAGMDDSYAMRDIKAPGAWAHAMALDNLLTLGGGYRRASYMNEGFGDGLAGQLVQLALEMVLAFGLILLLIRLRIKRWLDAFADVLAAWLGLRRDTVRTVLEALVGAVPATLASLGIAVVLLVMVPVVPPIDWIGVAALAVTAWLAIDAAPDSTSRSGHA